MSDSEASSYYGNHSDGSDSDSPVEAQEVRQSSSSSGSAAASVAALLPSTSSSTPQRVTVPPPIAVVKKVAKQKNPKKKLTRDSARNFLSERGSERRDTTDAKLAAAKTISKSSVWEIFSKFDTKYRLDLKEQVSCKICLKASEEDRDIDYLVEYLCRENCERCRMRRLENNILNDHCAKKDLNFFKISFRFF